MGEKNAEVHGGKEIHSEVVDTGAGDRQVVLEEANSISFVPSNATAELSDAQQESFPASSPSMAHGDDQLLGDMKNKGANADLTLQMQKYFFLVYLSAFAIFGTTLRVYIGRFFGSDCEFPNRVDDFLIRLSRHICITNSGSLPRIRGAVFTDFPGNIIGCLIMGVLSSLDPNAPPTFPWLRPEQQPNEGFHQAMTVGLCGCLTTFAAWNGQMVFMLNQADSSSEFATQLIAVILAAFLGMSASVGSFLLGGRLFILFERCRDLRKSTSQTSTMELPGGLEEGRIIPGANTTATIHDNKNGNVYVPEKQTGNCKGGGDVGSATKCCAGKICNWYTVPLILLVFLIIIYLVADWSMHIQFYRSMWITSLLSPPGAFLRWKLSKFNKKSPCHLLDWFPWGTFIANLLASALFVLLSSFQGQFLQGQEGGYPWTIAIITGIRTGFAGSLSTVSTLVKEIVYLGILYSSKAKPLYYSLSTILVAICLSLCIYTPIMMSG